MDSQNARPGAPSSDICRSWSSRRPTSIVIPKGPFLNKSLGPHEPESHDFKTNLCAPVQDREDKSSVIAEGNRIHSNLLFHFILGACGRCGWCVLCGGLDTLEPFIHAVRIVLFTQRIDFAQAFFDSLWESWERGVSQQPFQPTFPKLLICTAGI